MIRPATVEDVPRIVEMGQRFIADTSYVDRVRENPAQMERLVSRLITGTDGVVFVAQESWGLVGMIGLFVFEHPISGDAVASELFWWVNPEARGARTALALLRTGEQWAAERGAVWMHMIAPNDRVARLYERVGYARVEVTYERRL